MGMDGTGRASGGRIEGQTHEFPLNIVSRSSMTHLYHVSDRK